MNCLNMLRFFVVVLAVAVTTSCNKSNKSTTQTPGKTTTPPTSEENAGQVDELEGVMYPKAVIRFEVGERGSQQLSEGLHFVAAKREKGHLTHDIDGKAYVLSWDYSGSDEQVDKYRFALQMPDEEEPGFRKEISYSGERSMVFYNSGGVSVRIDESMDSTDD